MENEIDFLKQIARDAGYRIEKDDRGVERMYKPDGTLVSTAGSRIPEAPPPNLPDGVTMGSDGVCFRNVDVLDANNLRTTITVRVCEDCWCVIPTYIDFPRGLVSPESDGDANGNGAKTKLQAVGDSGKMGMAHLPKVVCLSCYLAAFSRVYPNAPLPELRGDATETVQAHAPEPSATIYVAEPKALGA